MAEVETREQTRLTRMGLSVGAAVMPFGVAFGAACGEAGLSWAQALGFSTVVFTGSAQFAAVSVLADGGAVLAAVSAGVLLNLRSLAFGLVMAPALRGPWWWRALASQLMIDESTAVGTAGSTPAMRRHGYLVGGIATFVLWNTGTALGFLLSAGTGDLITRAGIDATIPAAFLALLWPRLRDTTERAVAAGGGALALLLTPFVAPGLPVILAGSAVLVARPWRRSRSAVAP